MLLSRLWELAVLEACLKQLPGIPRLRSAKMLHVPVFWLGRISPGDLAGTVAWIGV